MQYWHGISLKDVDWDFDRDMLPILEAVDLGQLAEDIKRIIVERWGEPWRYYHGIGHFIDGLNKLWELIRDLPLEDRQKLILAWIFHDSVYLPGAELNEWASAMLARHWLTAWELNELEHDVFNLVLDSKYHRPVPGDGYGRLARLLYDVDLSRFAGPTELVAEDRELLYQELGGEMSREEFFEANLEFLKKLLERRKPLYQSPELAKYNEAAESNIGLIREYEL